MSKFTVPHKVTECPLCSGPSGSVPDPWYQKYVFSLQLRKKGVPVPLCPPCIWRVSDISCTTCFTPLTHQRWLYSTSASPRHPEYVDLCIDCGNREIDRTRAVPDLFRMDGTKCPTCGDPITLANSVGAYGSKLRQKYGVTAQLCTKCFLSFPERCPSCDYPMSSGVLSKCSMPAKGQSGKCTWCE